MPWKMEFHLDEQHDVVTAHFESCVLEVPDDAVRWRTEVERHLSAFGRKLDLLINLDGLVVKLPAVRSFGEERSAVLAKYATRSFRYGGDPLTRSSINTSGMRTGADVNQYETREQALRALLASREAGSLAHE